MEEFKNPFKSVTKSITKSVNKITKSASKTAKGVVQSSKTALAIPKKTGSSSSPPPPSQPAKYSLQQSNFNNDMYFEIFCNQNSGGYRTWDNQRFDTSKQDIISNTKQSNVQGCVSKCNQDKTCTSFHFKKKMDKGDSTNCTLFRSYPTKFVSDSKYQAEVKNNLAFNYNNLNSSQKTNVQKYCTQQYYQKKNPNKSFNMQSCFKGISTKSNKNYIDLDAQCVWSNIQSAGMGKTKSKMVLEKNPSLQNAKKNPFMDKYTKNWNEYKENNKKYKNIERDLDKYDPFFDDYNEMIGEKTDELKQEHKDTAEGTIATSALIQLENKLTVGGDLLENALEGFENQKDCKNCSNETIMNIFFILVICLLVYYLFLRK
jgi:hypothetical protein